MTTYVRRASGVAAIRRVRDGKARGEIVIALFPQDALR